MRSILIKKNREYYRLVNPNTQNEVKKHTRKVNNYVFFLKTYYLNIFFIIPNGFIKKYFFEIVTANNSLKVLGLTIDAYFFALP